MRLRVATTIEVQTKKFIAEQEATGVESLKKGATNHKRWRTTDLLYDAKLTNRQRGSPDTYHQQIIWDCVKELGLSFICIKNNKGLKLLPRALHMDW